MPYRSRNRSVRSTVRRKSLWVGVTPASTTLSASGAALVYVNNAALDALRPFTVVRTIMDFFLVSDQAAAIETQAAAFGWAVVSDQAAAAGIVSLPTPFTEIGSDLWFFHRVLFGDESAVVDKTRGGRYIHMESRAMRKVVDGEDMVGVVESDPTIGAGCIVASAGRILVKLN